MSGSVSLTDTTVTGNTVDSQHEGQGGGIHNAGVLDMTGGAIAENSAVNYGDAYGLGIYNTGTLHLTGTAVTGNAAYGAGNGGGIYNSGTATLANCSITQNANGDGGGGIDTVGSITLTDCTVANNSASGGGSIYHFGGGIAGAVTAIRTAIYGNYSAAYGGGVSGGGTFIDCTIANNSAFHAGGGIDGGGTFINSTITGNLVGGYSDGDGGGGLRASGAVLLHNTIVARNKVGGLGTGPDILGTVTTATFNLIGDGSGSSGVVNGVNGNQVGTGNVPIDPVLGVLQNNGGPTLTEALLPGSPAIDAGDNTRTPPTDQRGFQRIVNGVVDLGAYEYQPPATQTLLQGYPDPSTVGQLVTFTAQVTGIADNSNTPAGTVTFLDNGNVLATVPLVGGTATFATTELTAGSHTITAVYNGFVQGDFKFDPSLSNAWDQEVLPAAGLVPFSPAGPKRELDRWE